MQWRYLTFQRAVPPGVKKKKTNRSTRPALPQDIHVDVLRHAPINKDATSVNPLIINYKSTEICLKADCERRSQYKNYCIN
jgi:hypothetical protein